MPRIDDPATIRMILERDRPWSVYMLADLCPPYQRSCEWYATAKGDAVLLLYRGFGAPVLVAGGEAGALPALLEEAAWPPEAYVALRPAAAWKLISASYSILGKHGMWRMLLDPAAFTRIDPGGTVPLGPGHAEAVARLYSDGEASGEAPPFYDASMLESGLYYGVFEDGALTAAAGTHVLAAAESVACIGNVYTRRDRRGRGLAARLTAVVVAGLLDRGIRTIALNVGAQNHTARGIYRRLGFSDYCPFIEGHALRSGDGQPA